jgi:Na+-transporting NADH:ubiquinone oxidoreductase subunit NqrF
VRLSNLVSKKEIAYFYTAQKFRARFKREDYDNAPVKAKRVAYAFDKRNNQLVHKVRDSYWEVTVYGFPLDQIITGVQKSRSFKVTLKVNGG